jgi:hypothetical protein
MRDRRTRFALFLLGGALVLGAMGLAWALGPGVSEAQQGAMHNCPQAGKWAISVWGGDNDTDASQALDTCGAGAVAAAYSLDPQTAVWSRWFAGKPDVSNLPPLADMQGVLALGAAGAPPPATATLAATPTPAATPTAMPSGTWTGVWDTDWGQMVLTQSNGTVTGTYEHDQGQIQGTVQGNILTGTWSEYPSYAPPDDAGDFEFTLSADGNSFLGRWRYDSEGDWSEWTAARVS